MTRGACVDAIRTRRTAPLRRLMVGALQLWPISNDKTVAERFTLIAMMQGYEQAYRDVTAQR